MPIHPSLTVFDASIHQYIHTDFEIKLLDTSCRFSEGPVWNSEGFYLFSDIPQNVIYKIRDGNEKEIYLTESGCSKGNTRDLAEQIGSNGLAYDAAGNLLICQHGDGAIALYNGTFSKPHIASYNNKPFNSPNDIVAHANGTVFFSDPPYGLKDQKLNRDQGQEKACVYSWRHGELKIITDRYQFPNGVCLSPDAKTLYTCSNKPFEALVLAWDTETMQLKIQVAAENGDGIKCDRFGNLWLCTKQGILIINNEGKRLALLKLETIPANCCWGGAHGADLFITARQNIFLIPRLQRV